jgi:hypothetical protein
VTWGPAPLNGQIRRWRSFRMCRQGTFKWRGAAPFSAWPLAWGRCCHARLARCQRVNVQD